jgi:hypothetical protein
MVCNLLLQEFEVQAVFADGVLDGFWFWRSKLGMAERQRRDESRQSRSA